MRNTRKVDWSFINELEPVMILNRKYSKHTVEYYIDPDDDWFIYVVSRVKKDGSIKNVSMIIRKDAPNWKSYQLSVGWFLLKDYDFYPQNAENE